MNSHNAYIFLAIRKRLIDLQNNDGKKYLAFVDRNFQQLNFDQPPVKFPCGLIGGLNLTPQQLSENTQRGSLSITITLAFTPYSSTSSLKEIEFVEKAIAYFDLEQVIHMAMHGWHPVWMDGDTDLLGTVAGSLMRTDARELPRNDDIIVRQITYSLSIDDFSTKKSKTLIPRPEINIELLS